MTIIAYIVFALSLCADCFAVSLCSGVGIKKISKTNVLVISLTFAVIQTGLLLAGWAFGYLMLGIVERIAHWIGFLLLLYVGGSMVLEGIKGEGESRDLNGILNVVLGGLATSIDALAVGVSLSMDKMDWNGIRGNAIAVFAVTALSVVTGIYGGKTIGAKVGVAAEIIGGSVLICIGIGVLI